MVHMINSLTQQNRGDLDPDQLQTLIHEKLNSKRFLLVLDDMWSDDRHKWVEFRDLLEGGASGGKVIVTTRSTSVATTVGTVSVYNLKGFSHGDSLSLFKKWAFKEGEEEYYSHLMEIGDGIVKKCRGLPLAVRTLGTLLYSNTDDRYWGFIRDNEIWKLEQKENDILPELRDSTSLNLRHTAVVLDQEVLNSVQKANSLRTIICPFNAQGPASESFLNTCTSTCKFLRVLHLEGFSFEVLPHSIGALKHLRDLTLSGNDGIKRLPDSICKLHNLHSLSLGKCSALDELPSNIRNLVKLRFLEMTIKQKRLPENGIGCLTSLRGLSIVDCTNLEYLPEDKKNLRSLRILNIWNCRSLIS
ncbi:disease resistance protein RGA2-like [Tripterygium wilfordii]|uniref:disease resistance protein RGA2-like n=1 Tax=Tripterygium wilfordii TaxID=458696 RepID=UPI0018F83936|nr:disease resistance protein RGA2-like [Tripterygium wilfordii]